MNVLIEHNAEKRMSQSLNMDIYALSFSSVLEAEAAKA
jgi:hypothetical protein